MAKIFLHDVGHRHAQSGREILGRHQLLPVGILQQVDNALGEALSTSRGIELYGEFLGLRHLPEIGQIRAHNRYAIGARQVSNAATPRGRRIRHDSNR